LELVVNQVAKDKVTGYISVPKTVALHPRRVPGQLAGAWTRSHGERGSILCGLQRGPPPLRRIGTGWPVRRWGFGKRPYRTSFTRVTLIPALLASSSFNFHGS